MNDTSWRNLSALLGVACVVLIIAAGALLATSGESATPSPLDSSVASVVPSGSDTGPTGSPAPTPSSSPTSGPTAGPTATPLANAPIISVTFNNLMLDGSTAAGAQARTFTFVTDGSGPVGIAITKNSATNSVRACASLDGAKATCYTGTRVAFKGAYTDTAHSVWVVTLIGNHSARPTVDLALSWPSNNPKVTLTHGRLQGSSSPGVPVALNGFTATIKPTAAGNLTLSSSWTVITTDVKVTTEDVNATSSNLLDSKQYTSATNLGTPGYSFAIQTGKLYRVSLRDLSADSGRPDLTAILSVP